MRIVDQKITREELQVMSQKMFGCFVKAVVDIEKGINTSRGVDDVHIQKKIRSIIAHLVSL